MASTQGPTPRTNGKVITILSIDGGGVRGIIPAVILSTLEAQLQEIDGPDARIVDYFDVIAGTSTGSIVTALLTNPYTPPNPSTNASKTNPPSIASKANPPPNASQTNPPPNASKTNRPRKAEALEEFYLKHGPEIFAQPAEKSGSKGFLTALKQLVKEFDTTGIKEFVGDKLEHALNWLLQTKYDNSKIKLRVDNELNEVRLADTLTNVLIPAYDIEHLKLVTFSSYQERNKVPKSSVLLKDTVLGSTAAPTYFRRHHFEADGKIYNLVDGGMAANNPTLLAIREAFNIFGNRDDNRYLIISLGTGSEEEHPDFVDLDGPARWILDLRRGTPPLASVLFETSADMVDTYTSFFLGAFQNSLHQFLRIQDNTLKPEQLKMDDATEKNFTDLKNIANRLLDKRVSFPSSWIGLDPNTTNGDALKKFARDLSKIRGDAAKKLSDEKKTAGDAAKKLSDEKKTNVDSTNTLSDEKKTSGSSSSYDTGFLMYSTIALILSLLLLYKLYIMFHQ